MFRVGVAALVFVASFHPPVQSQWSRKADRAPDRKTAELNGSERVLGGPAEKLAATTLEVRTRPAQP